MSCLYRERAAADASFTTAEKSGFCYGRFLGTPVRHRGRIRNLVLHKGQVQN